MREVGVPDRRPVLLCVEVSRLAGLDPEAGADDFVLAPVVRPELYARIRQLDWRMSSFRAAERIKIGDLVIDAVAVEASFRGRALKLPRQEFQLLKFLAERPGRVFSREQLLSRVWGYRYAGGTRTVDIHVRRLRAKLGPGSVMIETVRHVGYKLRAPGSRRARLTDASLSGATTRRPTRRGIGYHPPPWADAIGISLGDPTGIGPEVVVRALAARPQLDVRVFGDVGVLQRAAQVTGVEPPRAELVQPITALTVHEALPGHRRWPAAARSWRTWPRPSTRHWPARSVRWSRRPSPRIGSRAQGSPIRGTQIFGGARGRDRFAMMLAGPKLRRRASDDPRGAARGPGLLDADTIARARLLAARSLRQQLGVPRPRVAVAGLNPHAGEAGRFGDEESRLVEPAVERARERLAAEAIAADITGPCVPDAVFRQAALDNSTRSWRFTTTRV